MRKQPLILFTLALAILGAAAIAGFELRGWAGALLFPLATVAAAMGLAVECFIIGCAITYYGHSTRLNQIRARVSRLSTDQLRSIAATPNHPDFGTAIATLARRGIQAKPSRQSLLDMLVASDSQARGRAMSFLQAFYPDVRLPEGSSSQDPPEVWRDRVAGMMSAD